MQFWGRITKDKEAAGFLLSSAAPPPRPSPPELPEPPRSLRGRLPPEPQPADGRSTVKAAPQRRARPAPPALGHFVPLGAPGHQPKMAPGRLTAPPRAPTSFPAAIFPRRARPRPSSAASSPPPPLPLRPDGDTGAAAPPARSRRKRACEGRGGRAARSGSVYYPLAVVLLPAVAHRPAAPLPATSAPTRPDRPRRQRSPQRK